MLFQADQDGLSIFLALDKKRSWQEFITAFHYTRLDWPGCRFSLFPVVSG